jgi:hypothetical protein
VLDVKSRESGGHAQLEVEVAPGRDVRAELARAFVQKGFDLLGLQQAGMSLEEIFLHLTTADTAEAAPPAGSEHKEVNA